MNKVTRFADIQAFTSEGNWCCDYTMFEALEQVRKWQTKDEGALNIDPDFQRLHVWTEAQQIAWLEYIMRGGRTGRTFYFNHPGWMRSYRGEFVLVDGKQRLRAMQGFAANEIQVFGSYLREFTDKPDRLRQCGVKLMVNDLKTRAEVLRWYIEMNAGGTPHTAEEIAKACRLLDAENARMEVLPG